MLPPSAVLATLVLAAVLLANRPAEAAWVLNFEDNFDFLNTGTWHVTNDCSTQNGCIHNNELQVYLASQVWTENGHLIIQATNEPYESGNAGWRNFRSGKIDSSISFSQLHGIFEGRMKLPHGLGMWPAFWMMPAGGNCWPTDGEIDIMEYVGKDPANVHGNYHFGQDCNGNHYGNAGVCGVTGATRNMGEGTLINDFHTYKVEWSPDFIKYFVDDVEYYHLSSAQCVNPGLFFLPSKPFYLILNLAVGGDWPGPPDGSTPFPQRLEVDWVRTYYWVN